MHQDTQEICLPQVKRKHIHKPTQNLQYCTFTNPGAQFSCVRVTASCHYLCQGLENIDKMVYPNIRHLIFVYHDIFGEIHIHRYSIYETYFLLNKILDTNLRANNSLDSLVRRVWKWHHLTLMQPLKHRSLMPSGYQDIHNLRRYVGAYHDISI